MGEWRKTEELAHVVFHLINKSPRKEPFKKTDSILEFSKALCNTVIRNSLL